VAEEEVTQTKPVPQVVLAAGALKILLLALGILRLRLLHRGIMEVVLLRELVLVMEVAVVEHLKVVKLELHRQQ
jgi:hypothetical protein